MIFTNKSFFILLMCFVWASAVYAYNVPKEYKVIVFLADGTDFDGYITAPSANYIPPRSSEVSISREPNGEKRTYTSDEVMAIAFPQSDDEESYIVYHSVKVQKHHRIDFNFKNPKPYKRRIFLWCFYQGENVNGYFMPSSNSFYGMNTHTYNSIYGHYYYKTIDDDVAKFYWQYINYPVMQEKTQMRFYLREFPELVKMVNDKALTFRGLCSDPTCVLPIMDKTYRRKILHKRIQINIHWANNQATED